MIEYTEDDFKSFIIFLGSYYWELADLIQQHMDKGSFKFNVKEKGSMGAASFITELQRLFPDVYITLFKTSFEDLPLYINEMHEGSVAQWRFSLGR